MSREELMLAVMNDISELEEPEEVLRGFNRVIGQINGVIKGVRDLVTAVDSLTAVSGWSWSDRVLGLKSSVKEVLEVYVDGEKWEHRILSEVERYNLHKIYSAIGSNKLQFASETAIASEIKLEVQRSFEKIDGNDIDSTIDIEIPSHWDEAIIAGIIAHLSVSKYKDVDRYRHNLYLYEGLLRDINEWESSKFPPAAKESYNYQLMGKSRRTL